MNSEYYWWDLENSKFKGLLYDSIGTYFLLDNYKYWQELVDNDPHMAYAFLIDSRFNSLEQQFTDLRVIPQMLGVQNIPLSSTVKNINRYDWLKSIVDLSLFRFSSIRDILFHFINEVLELNIDNYKLNAKNIRKAIVNTHPEIIENINQLSSAGEYLREHRNERAHKGFIDFFLYGDEKFKNCAWAEEDCQIIDYNISEAYQEIINNLHKDIVYEVENALKITINIVDALYDTYRDTFEQRAKNSTHGTMLSQHFNLHTNK